MLYLFNLNKNNSFRIHVFIEVKQRKQLKSMKNLPQWFRRTFHFYPFQFLSTRCDTKPTESSEIHGLVLVLALRCLSDSLLN